MTRDARKPIILVVDDIPENIDVLKGALVADYVVRPAPNGQVALRAVKVQPMPDIILLDIMMPDMDGYEVCRRLQEDPATREIPIIFVTARTEMDSELEGLRLGAVDYITKPFLIPIVLARIETHLALREARQRLAEQNHLLLEEREVIENILLKMRDADLLDPRHIRHLFSSVEATAGDILLAAFTADGRQWVMLGDFTGHGLTAAIGGPLVACIFHQMARNGADAGELLLELNRQLHRRLPLGMFCAAALLEVNPERTRGRLWNAGIPDVLWWRGGVRHASLASFALPLGIVGDARYGDPIRLDLDAGDRLICYSDGIIEALNPEGEMFGVTGLETFLSDMVARDGALDDLLAVLARHVGSSRNADDVTMIDVMI
ncbi:MAG: SpoIIE family protein phosphatase [Magnetococcales bacterium]|nr:SpoIIE family protein phosphatase [Magnetococcales bacterium]